MLSYFFCYHSSANKSDEYQLKNKVGEGDVLNSYGVTLKANMFWANIWGIISAEFWFKYEDVAKNFKCDKGKANEKLVLYWLPSEDY